VIKAGALEEAGRYDEAKQIVKPLLDRTASEGREHVLNEWAKLLVQDKKYDEAIRLIDDLTGKADPRRRCGLLHLRAKACDRAKDFAGAYEAAKGANVIGELPSRSTRPCTSSRCRS
jgi:predicted negative regulator of RcsB-dependent stress response